MTALQPNIAQKSLRELDIGYYIRHYFWLFWRWKWYILIAGPLGCAAAFSMLLFLGKFGNPKLSTTAVIGIENTDKTAIGVQYSPLLQNKAEVIRSRRFLERIVQKLSLQLKVGNYQRSAIFDSVYVDTLAKEGKYTFKIDKEGTGIYTLKYTNRKFGIKNKVIESGQFGILTSISIPGIHLKFSRSFLIEPTDFVFYILSSRQAIDDILENLSVKGPDTRREVNNISIVLSGTDYPLITETINAIADAFVEQNLIARKRRTRETIKVLEKQLTQAGEQLSVSKSALQSFLKANPSVGLSEQTRQTIANLMQLETNTSTVDVVINQARQLQTKLNSVLNDDDKIQTISEILFFLQMQNNISAPSLQAEFTQLLREKETLKQTYSEIHPQYKECLLKIEKIREKTAATLAAFIHDAHNATIERKYTIDLLTQRLNSLPTKELQLAELQRQLQVDSDVYSKIQARYNEAKAADAAEISDVFVLDYAVEPMEQQRFQQLLQQLIIVIFAGLGFAFGPAVVCDKLEKKARTVLELQHLAPWPALEAIPKFNVSVAAKADNSDIIDTKSEKLICNQPKPDFTTEIFRALRTKILMSYSDIPEKSLAIGSLNMGEGKSLIASNIAITIAQQGYKTILIDCDLRRGRLHRVFGLNQSPGVAELAGALANETSELLPKIIRTTYIPNLFLIPCGTYQQNPQELLGSAYMRNLLKTLATNSGFVIIDTPPLAIAADTAVLSSIVSRFVFVVYSGKTNVIELRKRIAEYPLLYKKVLGCVLNMAELDSKLRYRNYYSYYNVVKEEDHSQKKQNIS